MKQTWLTSVFPIALLFSFRMLGLFMLIPVFTIYANNLDFATPTLIGIALGSYGLSQGLLQIPFGLLSDRFGRKPIITIGLILFAIGSLMGAFTTSIYGMIFARIIQGTGAIGSVLIALLADLTTDQQRTKAMAVIGITIGFSFTLALILSPILTNSFGLAGVFYLTTILAILGLLLLHIVIPTPKKELFQIDKKNYLLLFKQVLLNKHLQRLNIGIFCQHFILTSTFFVIPLLVKQQINLGNLSKQWHFYLPLMLISFITMLPLISFAEKKNQIKTVFVFTVIVSGLSQLALYFTSQYWPAIYILMFAYFVAFNYLEASLPSLVSRQANAISKGTAMGIYSSSQFLGIFAGGTTAGIACQFFSNNAIFITNFFIAFLWLIISFYLKPNIYQITIRLPDDKTISNLPIKLQQLRALAGVTEVIIIEKENAIYLNINKSNYIEGSAEMILSK